MACCFGMSLPLANTSGESRAGKVHDMKKSNGEQGRQACFQLGGAFAHLANAEWLQSQRRIAPSANM
jgi:hypothetical protein